MEPQRGVEVTKPIQFGNCATSATMVVAAASLEPLTRWPRLTLTEAS